MKRFPQFTWNVTTVLFLVAVSICLAIVSGCSSNTVAPITEDTKAFDWLAEQGNGADADREPVRPMLDQTYSALIGPKGGVIPVQPKGQPNAVFIFPKDALKVEKLITITVKTEVTPFGNLLVYDCGPDGTVFDVPLQLVHPEPRGKTSASMYYFNEDKQQWELQETSVVKGADAVFHIYHFSKYGIQ